MGGPGGMRPMGPGGMPPIWTDGPYGSDASRDAAWYDARPSYDGRTSAAHDGRTSSPWDDWSSRHETSHVQTSDVEKSQSFLCFIVKIEKKITENLLSFSRGEIVLF